ncbi:MAG TPA: D-alanyl-D-alanine carboxypeptidase family protein [Actinomycetota bacterium]|nr:D-alanyl-D-alanine carboxypeptidase family protein [Actinomycetota bacterium]
MNPRILTAAIFATFLLFQPVAAAAAPAPAPEPPPVAMAAGILVDAQTGRVLWEKDDTAQRMPASLTKILTALVVLENANLDEPAPITPEARSAPGSRTYAEAGWNFTIRDHLWGLMLQSGNDSAIALAQKVSPDGTIAGFMQKANETAAALGATSTHFTNPHGYDEAGHITTARDLALITLKAMQNPTFAEIVGSKTHNVPWGDGSEHTYINHNKMLWRYQGTVGVKTGFTDGAGHTLATAVTRDGETLIAIVLGSPDHYGESMALYDWGFGNLPALRGAGGPIVKPKAAEVTKPKQETVANGLEVVQIDPKHVAALEKAPATDSADVAPFVGPALALIVSAVVWRAISRSRKRSRTAVFEEEPATATGPGYSSISIPS